MVQGQVKWFNPRKGYGFITPEGTESANDIFVHYSSIIMDGEGFRTLHEQDKVEFNIVDGQKGQEARDVKVTEAAPRPQSRRRRE